MNEQNLREYLQRRDVQERIQQDMENARSKATVTISRAASLFDFSESQLREWEKRGLLKTERPSGLQDGKSTTGHRQYSPAELDKLAIIRELMRVGYTLGDLIPVDVSAMWEQITNERSLEISAEDNRQIEIEHIPIEKRLEQAIQEEFWRYFVSQVLRISLLLICEDMPDTIAGLVLPLQRNRMSRAIQSPQDLSRAGLSLVGWLNRNRSFHTFLDTNPSFEYPSDFRIESLPLIDEISIEEHAVEDNVLIIVQRKAGPLPLTPPLVRTIRRLFAFIYDNLQPWLPSFDRGMHDWVYQVTDFVSSPNPADDVLNKLADAIVGLGGKTSDGQPRWHFCCILLPDRPGLPLQQRGLVVRAQSVRSPYKVGVTTVAPKAPGLTPKAYQSGHVIYRPDISTHDPIIAYHDQEKSTHAAIAVPIAGESGLSAGVIYISSEQVNAFLEEDQRVLRVMGRMVEELLMTYRGRQQIMGSFADMITSPGIIDSSFKDFSSENEFISDVEALLTEIHTREMTEEQAKDDVSFIAIDIDDQSTLATKYGDQVARNLSGAVGLRIQRQLRLFANLANRRLYHVNADRYYLLLRGVALEEARKQAEQMRVALQGDYRVDARRLSTGRPMLPEEMLELPNVTVRLGVTSYKYRKLKEVLDRYPSETSVASVRMVSMQSLDAALDRGLSEGGNVIISWDHELWGYRRWSPNEGTASP